ncbi:arginyl-tRNA synthetase [Bacillus oleivorans]|uniref:Arginine--tRNA ligase n=1 Tax=Bacillus oleivorans TaxID=1448271 RepID=A0A285D5W8_9BACI|nr:arginine--tRNA ligase [Bacillus oleivorans]SNX74553.1 arginyl-tRNA synthetase [Bacillus oleivorans]
MLHSLCSTLLSSEVPCLSKEEIEHLLEKPKHREHGDVSFPCFALANLRKTSPQQIAKELSQNLSSPLVRKIEAVGPYVNFFFDPAAVAKEMVNEILAKDSSFGSNQNGDGATIAVDLSSPNIAKPFSMGHLRSTVIGNSLCLIGEKNGYQMVKINYVGDWGTQFGKLIYAYLQWGHPEKVAQNPIEELFTLYVKFHSEAEKDPSLEEDGRKAFQQLEVGNQEYSQIWKSFKEASLLAFQKVYDLLGISFDSWKGESAYNEKMEATISILEEKGLLVESDGAIIVTLENENLPPCLIKKRDGATLYATRDLTAVYDRYHDYHFSHAFYVVGHEQSIHFKQVFSVLKKLEAPFADVLEHIPFGLYLKDGQKMSTRKGRVILLEEVLEESISKAQQNIVARNPDLPNLQEVAKQVGVGAILFHDLKQDRMNSIEFDLDEMLVFEGETGPYLQYTHARAQSLLRKSGEDSFHFSYESHEKSWELIKLLYSFPNQVKQAFVKRSPAIIAQYLLKVAKLFNQYYSQVKILSESEEKESRLALVKAVTVILKEGMRLLGMKAPDQM